MHQRRGVMHLPQDLLAAIDGFVDLETVPSPEVIAKDLVCGEIELKYCSRTRFTPGGKHLCHEIGKNAEKENHKYRNVRNDQKGRNYAERDHILSFIADDLDQACLLIPFLHCHLLGLWRLLIRMFLLSPALLFCARGLAVLLSLIRACLPLFVFFLLEAEL